MAQSAKQLSEIVLSQRAAVSQLAPQKRAIEFGDGSSSLSSQASVKITATKRLNRNMKIPHASRSVSYRGALR